MINPLPIIATIQTDTWIEADWEDFLTFADDPTLVNGRFYYDQGYMRIEMTPLGIAHGRDNSIISTVIVLYAALKMIPIKELTIDRTLPLYHINYYVTTPSILVLAESE